jgi:hypothetical protein
MHLAMLERDYRLLDENLPTDLARNWGKLNEVRDIM